MVLGIGFYWVFGVWNWKFSCGILGFQKLLGVLDGKPIWDSSRSVLFVQRTRGSTQRKPKQLGLRSSAGELGLEAQIGYLLGLDLGGASHTWRWASQLSKDWVSKFLINIYFQMLLLNGTTSTLTPFSFL